MDSNPSEATVFVAGATGYTGREVVRVFAEAGAKTVAHVRPGSSRVEAFRHRFESFGATVDLTPWDLGAMTKTLEGLEPTVVFSLLGTTRARAKGEGMAANEAYDRIDYGLTALLIDACVAAKCNARFVYLSAAGLREGTRNPYMSARVRAEKHLRQSGLAYTIARPSFITGSDREENRTGERVGAAVADRVLGLAGFLGARRFEARYRSVTGAALATGLVRVSVDPSCRDRVVHTEELR